MRPSLPNKDGVELLCSLQQAWGSVIALGCSG